MLVHADVLCTVTGTQPHLHMRDETSLVALEVVEIPYGRTSADPGGHFSDNTSGDILSETFGVSRTKHFPMTCLFLLMVLFCLPRAQDLRRGRSGTPLNEKVKLKGQSSQQEQTGAEAKKDLFEILRRGRHTPPVVFLKTHKTGSSTVQNLLFRMGEMHGATFAFPSYTYQFSYPDK